MYWAAKHGNVPAVKACLGVRGGREQGLTQTQRTALHMAALCGHAAVVKALIEAGADVNKPASPHTLNASGQRTGVIHDVTPVYTAAERGYTHVVIELIKAGADVNQATSDGFTPLYVAAQNGHEVVWPC